MNNKTWEHGYLDLLQDCLDNGSDRQDRTSTGTRALFGKFLDIDLSKGFPAVTTKKLAFKAMVSELLWFLEGSNDERRLCEILHGTRDSSKKTIWTDNAMVFSGDLGNDTR
jgi:thymidylate synthase